MARRWSKQLELVGACGEPVDLRRTLASHGVADLPPNEIDEEAWTLTTTLALPHRATTSTLLPSVGAARALATAGAARMMGSPAVFEDVEKTGCPLG